MSLMWLFDHFFNIFAGGCDSLTTSFVCATGAGKTKVETIGK